MPENSPIASPLKSQTAADHAEGETPWVPGRPQDNVDGGRSQPQGHWTIRRRLLIGLTFAAILVGATWVRFDNLGGPSFWYDEIVSVKLALSPSPATLVRLLEKIDAARAPLYPFFLQAWLRVVGDDEAAVRSLSAVFGLLTLLVIFAIGRQVGGLDTALWAMFFAGFSPLLVEYSREARMYSLLTLLTCLCWWNLLRFRDRCTLGRMCFQSLLMGAMIYTHPLALFMVVGLAAGWLVDRRSTKLDSRCWIMIQVATSVLIVPWIGHYFDHPPEFTSGRLPIKFLLGVPIGFTGGDARILLVFVSLVVIGMMRRPVRGLIYYPKAASPWPLLVWLMLPSTLLYVYSWFGHPIFGPSRYNVYIAPAYLILVARGMSSLGRVTATLISSYLVQFVVAMTLFATLQKDSERADWRRAADFLDRYYPEAPLIVVSPSPGRNFEVEVARYYVGLGREIIACPENADALLGTLADEPTDKLVFSASRRDETPLGKIPKVLTRSRAIAGEIDFQGLRFYIARRGLFENP